MERDAQLRASFDEFIEKGSKALKDKKYYPALSSFNLAKRIASELFLTEQAIPGKELGKLDKMMKKAKDKLDSSNRNAGKASFLARLKGSPASMSKAPVEPKKVSIFLFGLDRAGKTTLVEYLSKEHFKDHAPTLGINVSHLVLGNVKFEFNDLGGQAAFRGTWMDYWKDQDLLVFMVDAADPGRFGEARAALWSILERVETAGKPILILSNKIDVSDARRLDVVKKAIDFYKITNEPVAIHEISIKERDNLEKPLNFISSIVLEDEEMEAFVSDEIKRVAKALEEVYKALLGEAKDLEKAGKYHDAMSRIYKAKVVQDELLDTGYARAGKKALYCLGELSRLLGVMRKKGLESPGEWWKAEKN